ncbi:MAG: hypothetical protein HYU67_08050 [Flavobacteriia bacterium]|nr:hypothetical protein [Flavobacteriia bacterium]
MLNGNQEEVRNQFIDENIHLFWYIDKTKLLDISDEVLVEFIMNYGDLEHIKRLIELIGEKKVANIINVNLLKVKNKQRQNYRLSILNLIGKYFESKGLLKYS